MSRTYIHEITSLADNCEKCPIHSKLCTATSTTFLSVINPNLLLCFGINEFIDHFNFSSKLNKLHLSVRAHSLPILMVVIISHFGAS